MPMFHLSRLHKAFTESGWKLLNAVQESKKGTIASLNLKQLWAVHFEEKFRQVVFAVGQEDKN